MAFGISGCRKAVSVGAVAVRPQAMFYSGRERWGLVLTRRGKIFADSSPAIASSVAKGANDETGFLSGREDRGCGRSGVDEWFVRVGGMWFIRFIARQRRGWGFGLDVQGESWAG